MVNNIDAALGKDILDRTFSLITIFFIGTFFGLGFWYAKKILGVE